MPIRFHCPKCHVKLSVALRKAGHTSPCPNCRQPIQIPAAPPDASPPPLPAKVSTSQATLAIPAKPVLKEVPAAALIERSPSGPTELAPSPHPANARTPGESVPSAVPLMGQPARMPDSLDGTQERSSETQNSELAAEVARLAERERFITLPRWIVYTQAGLLGVAATTFFLMGLMIGQYSSSGPTDKTELYECQLTGQVFLIDEGKKNADDGAVVIVLPVDARIMERPAPQPLRPDEFQPIDNPSITAIEKIGGRVVRINRAGEFDLTLQGPREYFVLVISRYGVRPDKEKIPKSTVAEIGGFFFPAEDLIGDKKYFLTKIVLSRRSQNLAPIVF